MKLPYKLKRPSVEGRRSLEICTKNYYLESEESADTVVVVVLDTACITQSYKIPKLLSN